MAVRPIIADSIRFKICQNRIVNQAIFSYSRICNLSNAPCASNRPAKQNNKKCRSKTARRQPSAGARYTTLVKNSIKKHRILYKK